MSQLPPGFVLDQPGTTTARPAQQPLPSPPRPADPYRDRDQALQEEAAARAREDQEMQRQRHADQMEQARLDREAGVGANGTARESENKGAAFLLRALGSNEAYEGADVGPRSLVGQSLAENFPNALNALPGGIGNSPERQVSDSAQDEFIAATLRQDSGAAIPEAELARQRRIYFPMPGDGPEAIAQKRQARLRAIEGLRLSAGRLEAEAEERYARLFGNRATQPPLNELIQYDPALFENGPVISGGTGRPGGNVPPGGGRPAYGSPGMDNYLMQQNTQAPELAIERGPLDYEDSEVWQPGTSYLPPITDPRYPPFNEFGAPLVDVERGPGYGLIGQPGSRNPSPGARNIDEYRRNLQRQLDERGFDPNSGISYAERILQGAEMGLSDEIEGIGGALGSLFTDQSMSEGYSNARDRTRLAQAQQREAQGYTGTGLELLGGLAGPARGFGGGASGAARTGAAYGGLAGFGYGEGLENSLAGAGLGAAAGAGLGAGLHHTGNALAGARVRLGDRARNRLVDNAEDVARAGQAEGVNVPAVMLDPRMANRATGVEVSMAGGPRFNRGMNEVGDQIEGRVLAQGEAGTPLNAVAAGQAHQRAGERFIQQSGQRADRLYGRAEQLAGDARVTPTTSLQSVDEMITRLGETPGINQAEIAFLRTIRNDLSSDLSVSALRRMRTTLRKKINNGDLVYGEDQARVLGIMDAAAQDIRTGLAQQGRAEAATAFDAADTMYRERMDFINNTLQGIIGKRGQNFSADRIARNLDGMLRGKDTEGVRRFFQTLTREERDDVAATVAQSLGRRSPDEPFSVSTFLTNTREKNFPQASLRLVFGEEGAASIARLRTISREFQRVQGTRNNSRTGVANDYRSWLFNAVLGAGTGAGTGSVTAGVATAVIPAAVKAGRDIFGARALLSPGLSQWLLRAPRTNNPAAINRHLAQLTTRSGAIMNAKQIHEYLAQAIQQSPGRAAAQDEPN